MFPIGDDNSARRSMPVVTVVLIALNVLFFFVEFNGGDAFIRQWAFIPRRFGENPAGNVPTVFTAMFMHGGWLHLGGNMLYLWIFGDNVEDDFGPVKFLIFYLVCGVAATFAQYFVVPESNIPNVGASGAIAGVLGAYLVMFPTRARAGAHLQSDRRPACADGARLLDRAAGIQRRGSIAQTAQTEETGGIAYMAHVGGFVAGLVLALLLRGSNRQQAG